MIVGLALVNLKAIWERSSEAGVWLTREITADPTRLNGTPGVAIALAFGLSGFLLMYLWCLRYLPSELRQSYMINALASEIKRLNKNLLYFKVPAAALDRQIDAMRSAGVDDVTLVDVRTRYSQANSVDYEAMQDFGPNEAEGYALLVKVTHVGEGHWSFVASLSTPVGAEGKVFWLLHNTFSPEVVSPCPIKPGATIFENSANEPFWIGAVIPRLGGGTAIRLGFDLANAEGSNDLFRNAGKSN